MSNSFNLKERLNYNVTKHLQEEPKRAELNYFKSKEEQKGIFHFQEVNMCRDRLRDVIGKDNESKRATVFWNNGIYERSSLSLEEYKKRKHVQLRNDCKLAFAITLFPTLNLPGSPLREVKTQEKFTGNILYSDAVLSASFLINWIKVVVYLTMLKLLVTFLLSYQGQGLQELDITQGVSYDTWKYKLSGIYARGLRILQRVTDEPSLSRLTLRSFSKRIERLSPSWSWLFKGILLLSLILLLASKLIKKLNRWVYDHAINSGRKVENRFKVKKPANLIQVLKNLSSLDIFDVIRCSVFRWGSDKNVRFCLQTYFTSKILDAYKSTSRELKVYYPSSWERRLSSSVVNWMEQKLDNVIRENTSFELNDKGLIEFKTHIYPIREGTQYINVVDDPDLARSVMAVMSRNESSVKSPSLSDYRNPNNEYHSHGSTGEATMRSIELRKVSWLLPYVIFNVPILFGMETSTRVLNLKPNPNLARTPWEEAWEKWHEDLLSDMDGKINSAYSKDNKRMFTLMNFQTSCNLTIPNSRHLANLYSIVEEILNKEELLEIHPDARLLMDQMYFIGVDKDKSQSRNRTRLISGISLIQPENNLVEEEVNLTDSDFWKKYVSMMIPNLELTVSKEATHGDENDLDELVVKESKNGTHYCRFDPTIFDLSHVDVRFSLITSLTASRDVQRHRTGSNWNHKMLSLDKKPVIHPFYTNSKVIELMKDFPISLEGRRVRLTDLLQFPSSSLMKLSNRMSFENVVFLLKTRIQSNPEYALLFTGFYLKLLKEINSINASILNEEQKSFLRKQLTNNIKVDEVVKVIDKSVKILRPNLSDSDCKVPGNLWRSVVEEELRS